MRIQSSTAPESSAFPIKPWHIGIFIFICASYLSLWRLDYTSFWDDEAEVGIVAKNLLQTGKLTGWDGRNLFGYNTGTLLDKNLRPINPPLEYWLAAASFKVFGISTWAGRFPFALLGLGALGLFAVMLRRELKANEIFWVYAVALFAFSVTFLLFIRQCRYYSLTLFFSLLTFYFYRRCLENRKPLDFVLLAGSAALLFYSHYLICAAFMFSLVVIHFVFYRKKLTMEGWSKFAFSGVLFLLATVPYALKYKVWVRPDLPNQPEVAGQKLRMLGWIFRDVNSLNSLPWMMAVALFLFLWMQRKNELVRRTILPWLSVGIVFLIFLGFLSEVPEGSDESPIRYFLPVVPFFAVALSGFFWFVHQQSKILALGLFAVLISTNIFGFSTREPFTFLLPAYISEIHRPYPTPYRAASEYLEKNAEKDATVFCYPDFCSYPLMFYTGDKFRFGGSLDFRSVVAEKKVFTPEALSVLPAEVYYDEFFPDYFIAFGKQEGAINSEKYFSRSVADGGRNIRYELVNVIDQFWYDTSRPELTRHTFEPRKDFKKDTESVYIFKKVK